MNDFIVCNIEEEAEVQIIIGIPFLITTRVKIYLESRELNLKSLHENIIRKFYDCLNQWDKSPTWNIMNVLQKERDKQKSPS